MEASTTKKIGTAKEVSFKLQLLKCFGRKRVNLALLFTKGGRGRHVPNPTVLNPFCRYFLSLVFCFVVYRNLTWELFRSIEGETAVFSRLTPSLP